MININAFIPKSALKGVKDVPDLIDVLNNPKFQKLREFLSDIPYINRGGCAISAIVMYDWLVKNGYNAKIIFGTWDKGSYYYRTNLQAKKGNTNFSSTNHAFIKLDKLYFDCKEIIDRNEYRGKLVMQRKHVIMSIKEGHWNESFDRDRYLPKIEKKIGYKIL